jgi:hypothetical protein
MQQNHSITDNGALFDVVKPRTPTAEKTAERRVTMLRYTREYDDGCHDESECN